MKPTRSLILMFSLILMLSSPQPAFSANTAPTYRSVIDHLDSLSSTASVELKKSAETLKTDLKKLVATTDFDQRLLAYQALERQAGEWLEKGSQLPAAADVGKSLSQWVAPRLKALQYAISARDSIKRGDAHITPDHKAVYEQIVVPLVDSLEQYEAADKVGLRFDAREKIRDLVGRLEKKLAELNWPDAREIISTIESRWESPNLLFTISEKGLKPLLDRGIVNNEAVQFKGRVSYVSPGDKQGFGLIPSDDAIGFYIRQSMTSRTPVTDFESQVQSNQGGRLLTRAYALGNTIQNDSILTMSFAVRPTGVSMSPSYENNVQPQLSIAPRQGGGLTRMVMGLAGMNQQRIVNEIYNRSIGQIQSETEINSKELGQLRANEAAAELNNTLKAYARSEDTLNFDKIVAERIKTRTEPTHIHAEARLFYEVAGIRSIGPLDVPPPLDPVDERYVTAALHVPNVMENLAANFFEELSQRGKATIAFLPDNDGDGALEIEIQSGQELLHLAVGESLRITREPKSAKLAPGAPFGAITISEQKLVPHFTMDSKGHLIMIFKAFKMDIAAPALTLFSEGRMGGAIRIDSPGAELDMEIINLPASGNQPERLALKVHSFQLDPRSKIYAYSEAGKEPTELSAFRKATVLAAATGFLASRPLDLPLDALRFGDKVKVVKVSPLGKLGWFQFVVDADALMQDLGKPAADESQNTEAPASIADKPKTDDSVNASAYAGTQNNFTARVPAGAKYWVVPGTNPPQVFYELPAAGVSPQWVDVPVSSQD
jgi:hypothetical protein